MILQNQSFIEKCIYFFSFIAPSGKASKAKSFCQKRHTLWRKQYEYKIQPKTQAIRNVSAEIKRDQSVADKPVTGKSVADKSSLFDSSCPLEAKAGFDNVREKAGEKVKKIGIIKFFKDKSWLLLCIHLCLLVVFSSISSIQACSGRFVNPITDICWSCLFPITIGPVKVSGGHREDTPNARQIPCQCPRFPYVGIPVGFWEPARLVDVTSVPFCMVNMGGKKIATSTVGYGVHGANGSRRTQNSFYQVHWYIYPVVYWLELIVDFLCLEQQSFDVAYMTELDPLWNADELSFILNPEAVLFGNLIAQAACAADCTAATSGFPLDPLFWCGGCQGSLYPFTGNNAAHNGGVQASLLMVQRMMAKLHRELLLWGTSGTTNAEICDKYPLPVIKKTQYKTQMTYPIPTTRGPMACNPLGRTEVIWGSGREFPYKGEDFGYLIWRKRNCCIL